MARWIALGCDGTEHAAYALDGGEIIAQSRGADETEALGALPGKGDQIIRIGTGAPQSVPCAVLPENGADLPVITQDNPPDVLGAWHRIWIAGFLGGHENWDGVIWAIDADLSTWIHVSADEVISFASFLTPRLLAALNGANAPDQQALSDTMSRPERLASHLRQAELGGDPRSITGHLLGAELAAARPYWLGQQVAIVIPQGDALCYAGTLEAQGVPVSIMDATKVLKDGLASLYNLA